MYSIEKAAGQVVAGDTQASVEAVDRAVVALAQLCANIVEVSKASHLPVATAQGALTSTGDGLARLIATRADMSAAAIELGTIQKQSSLREVSFGCPGGFGPTASDDRRAPVARAEGLAA